MPRHLLFLIYNDTDNTAPDGKIKLVVDDTNIATRSSAIADKPRVAGAIADKPRDAGM